MKTDRYMQILNDISENMGPNIASKAELIECIRRLMELETAWITRYNAVRGALMLHAIGAVNMLTNSHSVRGGSVLPGRLIC